VIVRRAHDLKKIKVHYPHWDASVWDEWVDADRIRWSPGLARFDCKNTAFSLLDLRKSERSIVQGDDVEVLCPSTLGVSPWLETRVFRLIRPETAIDQAEGSAVPSEGQQDAANEVEAYVCRQGILSAPQIISPEHIRLLQMKTTKPVVEEACVGCSPRAQPRAWGAPPASAAARHGQGSLSVPPMPRIETRWQRAKSSLKRVSLPKWRR